MKYNRKDHWVSEYQDNQALTRKPRKVFSSMVGSCPCDERWKASKEYKAVHTFESVPYHRDAFWEMFVYDWVSGINNRNKNAFRHAQAHRGWKCGFKLGFEEGK